MVMMEEGDEPEATRVAVSPDDHVVRAVERLFRREYDGMVRLAFTLLRSDSAAEEAVQDAFVEVYGRWHQIREPGAYLRTAVVSRCHTMLRRQRMAERVRPDPPVALSSTAAELWDVLDRLPEIQRIVVVLRHQAGYRASEVASMLDVPAATVRSHDRRGLAALREELER